MIAMNEKAWVFHRGKWRMIKNPLHEAVTPDSHNGRQSLRDYRRKWWRNGPTFLYPQYLGFLVYTYVYIRNDKLPEYLIWINASRLNIALYAQDFPDLIEVLAWLAPLVQTGIFVDIYRRSQEKDKY